VALLHGWQAAGSGAAYQLEVGEAGAGVVELAWGVPPAPGTVLEVSLAGSPVEQQLEGPSWTTRDALELRQGPAVLLLRVVSAPANAGEAGLAEVRLRRLRSGS
jgi:hypothetical protein